MTEHPVWHGFTRAALDEAYDNARAVPHGVDDIARLQEASAAFRKEQPGVLDIAYGPLPRQRIDLFKSPAPRGGLFAFIHGGYWQMRDKETFAALARGPLVAGWDVATIGYTLAPEASLTQIVEECANAVRYLKKESGRFGIAAERFCVSGWSAGGHLAAMMLELDEVDVAVSISGIFDLEPIRHCYLNDKLKLSVEEARLQSPIHRLDRAAKPLSVVYGLDELPELQRQSDMYYNARIEQSLPTHYLPLAGCNHFSVLPELGNEEGLITKHLTDLKVGGI